MNTIIINMCFAIITQISINQKIFFPEVSVDANTGYILYTFLDSKLNSYFLVDAHSKKIIFVELNSDHDSGESWLDVDENEIREHFGLNKNVKCAKEINGMPLSSRQIILIEKQNSGTFVQIGENKLQILKKYSGFIFLKSVDYFWEN